MKPARTAIYFVDAAFDHGSKTAIVGGYELESGESFQEVFSASSPFDAELRGILKVLEREAGAANLLVFNDSKKAISAARKKVFAEHLNPRNRYLQLVWLPRRYQHLADHLSKNIEDHTLQEEIAASKTDSAFAARSRKAERLLSSHVNDILPDASPSEEFITKRLEQFRRLKDQEFSSRLFSGKEISPKESSELILTEIDKIEQDISSAKDQILKILMKNILDLLIFL